MGFLSEKKNPFLTKEEQIHTMSFFKLQHHGNMGEKRKQTKMYILVVFKNKNLCNIVINIDIIMIICKVFYSVIGFKAMFLSLPVRYCT